MSCGGWWYLMIIIIMEICKAPTLRFKALNKNKHIMYIETENVMQNQLLKKKISRYQQYIKKTSRYLLSPWWQNEPWWKKQTLRDIRLCAIRLCAIRLRDIRLCAIRLCAIRLRDITLGAIRLGVVRLGDCEAKRNGTDGCPSDGKTLRRRARPSYLSISGTCACAFYLCPPPPGHPSPSSFSGTFFKSSRANQIMFTLSSLTGKIN